MELKTHYSLQDLKNLNIDLLPSTVQGLIIRAEKENWNSRKRQGRGGGLEYEVASMPKQIQIAIREHVLTSLIIEPKKEVVEVKELVLHETQKLDNLNDKQREIADARLVILHHIAKMEQVTTRQKAILTLIDSAKNGTLDNSLLKTLHIANARANSNRIVSERTIMRWISDCSKCTTASEKLEALAPAIRVERKAHEIDWFPLFLKIYQKPNGVSVAEAYDEFSMVCLRNNIECPSIHKVRRALAKISKVEATKGRVTGSQHKAMLPYVKRDWEALGANAIWVGDGTSLKAKVRHPDHGRPFIPELTMIIDPANRYIVGWSVSLAENTLAVADAFRNGVENHGLPLIYYSDNGSGQTAKLLDDDVTGIFARLGVDHQTGIAGNPQGRGVIERLNKTVAHRIARQFPTCFAGGSDKESVRKMLVELNSLTNAEIQGKELTEKQLKTADKIPTWKQFIDICAAAIDWYNHEHMHSELKMTPFEARTKQLKDVDITFLNDKELRDLFRPEVIRTVERGWISLFNNDYFSMDLADYNGEKVRVSFDIHNADSVIIRNLDGGYICDAKFNGNKRDAFPRPYIEKLRDDRMENRKKLALSKLNEIEAERKSAIDVNPDFSSLFIDKPEPKANKQPIFLFESEKEDFESQTLTKSRG